MERSITKFSDDPPYVSLHNGTPVFSDCICVEYFRLYLIAPEGENLKRYTYFEIYYDNYIVTCLTDMAAFRKNGANIRFKKREVTESVVHGSSNY